MNMPFHNVYADTPWSQPRVLSFLNEKNIKYRVSHFSSSYSEKEIEHQLSRLGLGLLEGAPIEISGRGLVLAIIPSALALKPGELSNPFAGSTVRPLTRDEFCQRLSLKPANSIPPLGPLFGLENCLSPLVEQHHTLGFLVDSKSTLITLEASEFRRSIGDASLVPLPLRPRYRAYASKGRKKSGRCILGVSLESAEFYPAKLVKITDWIRQENYADCHVMLGDGLHRITLQLDSTAGEKEALEHSKWLAREFAYSNLSVFNLDLKQKPCRFDFVFCSEIQKRHDYADYYDQLRALLRDDKEFRNSVEAFSFEFLKRKPYRHASSEKHLQLSSQYLLEELAVICCLAQASPCTFVYPGSLTILQEIADGKHPSVPASLLQIDYVELNLKYDLKDR
jgi:tRNA-dependent cyclodipeptide synthase